VSHARPRRERKPFPAGFGTIWTTVALDLIGFGIVLPILPLYAERFGASATTIGILLSTFSIAQLLLAPVWGRISDRVGRKPVILISLFGTAAGSFLTGAAGSLPILFLGRLVDGASGASVSVAQAAVADVAEPSERPRLLGLLGAAFGVGFVAGPALGALAALGGPHVPFYLAGCLALANAVVAIRRLPETAPRGADSAAAGGAESAAPVGAESARNRRRRAEKLASDVRADLWRLALCAFVGTAAFAGFEATFALFGQARFDLTLSSTGAVFAVIGLFLVLVQAGLVHPVVSRLGAVGTLRGGLMLNIVGLLLLAVAIHWPVLVLALAALIVGQGLTTPTLASIVAGRSPTERRGGALGLQQMAGGLGRVIGPVMAGALFQHVGVGAPYVVGAGITAAALALVLTMHEHPAPGFSVAPAAKSVG
jgi:MFS family permease